LIGGKGKLFHICKALEIICVHRKKKNCKKNKEDERRKRENIKVLTECDFILSYKPKT